MTGSKQSLPADQSSARWAMTHRQVDDPAPGGLTIFKVEDVWLIPAPAICYECYADCASLEQSPCPHFIDMLQADISRFTLQTLEAIAHA